MLVARILIERELTDEGHDIVTCSAQDNDGDDLPLIQSLGMLRMAEDTVIRAAMGDDDAER